MDIISNPDKDVRTDDLGPGGYEWWYFDALSSDGRYGLVVIFYQGNPFSTRYNRAIQNKGEQPFPSEHPAVSISIYEEGSPVYYSFTEFEPAAANFAGDRPLVEMGGHRMERRSSEGRLTYELDLRETLPSGDTLEAFITFESPDSIVSAFADMDDHAAGHCWNLVQPRAVVKADIRLEVEYEESRQIQFEGLGYHDHNTGQEPMRDEFADWYWGRFHFDYGTLIYYVMNRRNTRQHEAWLIGNQGGEKIDTFDGIELKDTGFTIFGLKTARKLRLHSEHTKVQVQQSHLLDNGPFYQRYKSEAFLHIPSSDIVESKSGITEYIRPGRIFNRLFWPFVNMRIRYRVRGPNWVQRSKRLYRWTW